MCSASWREKNNLHGTCVCIFGGPFQQSFIVLSNPSLTKNYPNNTTLARTMMLNHAKESKRVGFCVLRQLHVRSDVNPSMG